MILYNIVFYGGGKTNEGLCWIVFQINDTSAPKKVFFQLSNYLFTSFIRVSESMKYEQNIIFDLTQTVFQMSHSKIGQEITLIIPKSLLFQTSCQVQCFNYKCLNFFLVHRMQRNEFKLSVGKQIRNNQWLHETVIALNCFIFVLIQVSTEGIKLFFNERITCK